MEHNRSRRRILVVSSMLPWLVLPPWLWSVCLLPWVRRELAEWLKAHAWKVCMRVTVSGVRIPHSLPGALRLSGYKSLRCVASLRSVWGFSWVYFRSRHGLRLCCHCPCSAESQSVLRIYGREQTVREAKTHLYTMKKASLSTGSTV